MRFTAGFRGQRAAGPARWAHKGGVTTDFLQCGRSAPRRRWEGGSHGGRLREILVGRRLAFLAHRQWLPRRDSASLCSHVVIRGQEGRALERSGWIKCDKAGSFGPVIELVGYMQPATRQLCPRRRVRGDLGVTPPTLNPTPVNSSGFLLNLKSRGPIPPSSGVALFPICADNGDL